MFWLRNKKIIFITHSYLEVLGNKTSIVFKSHEHKNYNMGITNVLSCINICQVPRKVFEHEADRDLANVNAKT